MEMETKMTDIWANQNFHLADHQDQVDNHMENCPAIRKLLIAFAWFYFRKSYQPTDKERNQEIK